MRRKSLYTRLAAISPRRLLLFLDYDGTLTPIVQRPAGARMKASVRRTLRRLARVVPVVIVSGRTLTDLQRRVGVRGLHYVALHGLVSEEAGGRLRWLGRPPARADVNAWKSALASAAHATPGALVEDKGCMVALHDRLVRPVQRARLRRRALRALAPWLAQRRITVVRGKRVLEVRPREPWNKGTAVQAVLARPWARNRIPVYCGDDRTDLDAFRVVRGRGITIGVGQSRHTRGQDAWLRGPSALERLLRWFLSQSSPIRRGG
jgi:trehalose 6-phosphate phosphatase